MKNIEDFYPLSPMQQGILFHSLYAPESAVYCEVFSCNIEGKFNILVFKQAWQQLLKRHPILRTSFVWKSLKEPAQIVHKQVKLPWEHKNWCGIESITQQERIETFLGAEQQQGFDIAQAPLMRLTLIKLAEYKYQFVWSHHHLLLDGWSSSLLMNEVFAFYKAFSEHKDLSLKEPRSYRDYIAWLQQQNLSQSETFWRERLQKFTATTPFSIDHISNHLGDENKDYKQQQINLSTAETAELQSFARQQRLTLNTLIQAAWAILLSRYSGENDVVFGSVVSGRGGLAGTESMVGVLINTVPIRVCINPEEFLIPWLKQLQALQNQTRQYEQCPLIEIQKWSDLPVAQPLFESILNFQNYPIDFSKAQQVANLKISNICSFIHPHYPLNVSVKVDSELLLEIFYETYRFDPNTIARMLGHFRTLLLGMTAKQQQRVKDLPLLTAQEHHQLLVDWNDTQVNYPQQCIHQLFEAQVKKTPDAVAVVFENQQLTYCELNAKANQLAHYLQELGVKSEVLVGICVERSLAMVIGLLAILKAGGAYVPLDPSYPQERLAYILEDTQASVLLTQASLLEVIPPHKAQVVCVDTDCHLIEPQSQENLFSQVTPDNLAYTIYTSGSTGKPKGVQIPHVALNNFLFAMQQSPGITTEDTLLAVTTYSFDIAALELFLPITVGASLIITSRQVAADGTQLSATLTDYQVTVMQATPATWQLLLAAGWHGNQQLKILCGGEALPGHLAYKLRQRCNSLWNMYGPTETTIWSAASLVKTVDNTVPISQPIANTQLYILDQYHQLVPVGVAGELCIGGEGLARGYFHRPDLTAEKFIPNPFSNKAARLYKTGDLARYLPNGEIEYIGRIDNQVKIRGFRIELGEIEALITQYPAVGETVVVVRSDLADSQQIVAYVVPQQEQKLTISELRSFLESKLPNYMIPAALVTLSALPLTPNGKIDRKALPATELTQLSSSNYVPPSTPIENLLVGIWAEILKLDKIGIHDNFFELGGHSLIATRVISQIRQVFSRELPLRCLFEKPTIAGLATEIEIANKAGLGTQTTKIEPIERSPQLPLSFAQQRLWFLTQLEPDSPFYNIPTAVRLQGELNFNALQKTFTEILHRHETLRTNFQAIEGQAITVIQEATPLVLSLLELSQLPLEQQELEVKQQAAKEAQQPFDINSDHLLRVKLLRLREQEHIVLLTMHHIASDGWSIGVLVQELATLYSAFCNGEASPLTELPIQYVDFAAWQRQWLQAQVLEAQISYWRSQLENAPKLLELPTDYPRPAIQTFRGATYSFNISEELSLALNKLSQQQGSTLFMTLLAAFQTLLWRYTGQEDIVVGSPIANRNRAEIEGLIGFFVNTLVLRTNLAGNPRFEELLKRVREVALGAYAHQDLPFELLIEQLQPQRDLSYTPLFQVMFVLQNAPMSALELPGLSLSPVESESNTSKFDLTLYMSETESGIVGNLEYNTDLFQEGSIHRMVEHLQTLLSGIVVNPQQRLSELSLLSEPEKYQLLQEWNETGVEYPQYQCIHELFEAQVQKTPDAIAVVFEDEQLTYCELNARANQLAHYLRSLGVKSEVLVGICVERSLAMVIGLLAILKAGGAYLPLDPSYPTERLAYILNDTQTPLLLTQQSLREKLPAHQAHVVCLDVHWEQIAQENQTNPVNTSTANNLAYVIYTSGSTGKPKGVMIKHTSTVAMLDWANKTYAIEARKGVLASTSICFDLSVFEMFVPLCCGGTIVLVENALHLPALPTAQSITLINSVPSVISQLLITDRIPTSVQTVNIAGEPLHNELVQRLYEQSNIQQVLNLYGPSEDTTYSTSFSVQKGNGNKPPIGRPIHNTQIYILDQYHQLVPVGVAGELCIGGEGLARGYFHRPDLTAEKFIPNPFSNKAATRLYKTGDLARYLPSGEIEYIGRIDNQVKIRGFRIELGEIEIIITQHPAIKEAVVVVREDIPGDKRLVAYMVFKQELVPKFSELRSFLKEKLPDYMLPTAFLPIKALPLTPNGKVNRQALPAPDNFETELRATFVQPRNHLEISIASIWQKVLKVEKIGIHDNFFDIGGHSLLLLQVHNQLREIFSTNLLVLDLFRYPTISSLAVFLNLANTNQLSDFHPKGARTQQLEKGKARIKRFLKISKEVK